MAGRSITSLLPNNAKIKENGRRNCATKQSQGTKTRTDPATSNMHGDIDPRRIIFHFDDIIRDHVSLFTFFREVITPETIPVTSPTCRLESEIMIEKESDSINYTESNNSKECQPGSNRKLHGPESKKKKKAKMNRKNTLNMFKKQHKAHQAREREKTCKENKKERNHSEEAKKKPTCLLKNLR